jgi:putative phosphoesterase
MSTVAFLSDIHGNDVALQAALADMQPNTPEQIIFLGDAASDGAQPHQVLSRLQTLDCVCIRGNMDDFLLKPEPRESNSEYHRRLNDIARWSAAQITDEERAFLQSFVPIHTLSINGLTILCFHGSPHSNTDLILATTDDATMKGYFADTEAAVCIGGHTHTPLYRRWNRKMILNPGSVGLASYRKQARMFPVPVADYVLMTVTDAGQVQLDFRRVPYDPQPYFQAIRDSGLPHAEWLIARWNM